jgi:hypothetical protein
LTAGNTASSATATATGTQADSAWSGTGNGTVIGVLKSIWTKLGTALNIRALSSTTDSVTIRTATNEVIHSVTDAILFTLSTVNSSSTQLAAGATFTGVIESSFNQPAAQLLIVCDQPYTVYADQFDGANNLIETSTFTRTANQGTNENIMLKGDSLRVRVTNTGAALTTTFRLETTYGQLLTLPTSTSNKGNFRTSIEEFNATSLPLPTGAATAANQATEIASLASIVTSTGNIPAQVNGALPVNLSSFSFAQSTANVTTTQLGAGTTWNGSIETAFNQQGIQIMCNADQPYTITVTQYQDLAGTKPLGISTFTRAAGSATNETLQVNGNFVRVSVTNNGTATTTTLFVDTTYGPLSPFPTQLSNNGNFKVSLNENNAGLAQDSTVLAIGAQLQSGARQSTTSQSVVIAYDQFAVLNELLQNISLQLQIQNTIWINELKLKETLDGLASDLQSSTTF